ncbi:MAG: nuclear transport factor 2 family protein [Polyangiales bacterium]
MEQSAHRDIAMALTDCLTRGDVDGVAALYSDDATVWRNFDGRELTREQMLKVIGFLATAVNRLQYDVRAVHPTETGFVQEHTMTCESKNGKQVRVDACLVAYINDGKITRLNEYLDSLALQPLMEKP